MLKSWTTLKSIDYKYWMAFARDACSATLRHREALVAISITLDTQTQHRLGRSIRSSARWRVA
jgi:hypothetical protein